MKTKIEYVYIRHRNGKMEILRKSEPFAKNGTFGWKLDSSNAKNDLPKKRSKHYNRKTKITYKYKFIKEVTNGTSRVETPNKTSVMIREPHNRQKEIVHRRKVKISVPNMIAGKHPDHTKTTICGMCGFVPTIKKKRVNKVQVIRKQHKVAQKMQEWVMWQKSDDTVPKEIEELFTRPTGKASEWKDEEL